MREHAPHRFLLTRAAQFDRRRHILVLSEKYGTSYFDPRDWGGYIKLLAHLFRRSDKLNGWYPSEEPKNPGPAPATPKDITDPELRNFIEKRLETHWEAVRAYQEDMAEWRELTLARAGDDLAAANFFESRKDLEYEGFELEPVDLPLGGHA